MLAREILLVVPLVICAESLMLYCVLKFRTYLVRRMSADDTLAVSLFVESCYTNHFKVFFV